MMRTVRQPLALLLLLLAACGPQADTPDDPAPAEHDEAMHHHGLTATDGEGFTAADVAFMQMMIGHHAQALTMAEMVPDRTENQQLLNLAQKIEISQHDEIALMKRWLRERNQEVPDEHQMHQMEMPGLVSQENLVQLEASQGIEFERLFLNLMIEHHLGAVQMVEELFASPGAAQDSDIFAFANDVGADQLDEIGAMESMLESLGSP
jgi:uncharacterized protein (DUF305 family)